MALLENPVVLEAMLELAAVVAGGKVFVTSTYNLEVGGFGVVIAFDQISKIEAALDAGIPMPALAAAAKRAAELMKPLKDAKDDAVAALEAAHAAAKAALAELAVAVPEAVAVDAAAPEARGGSGRCVGVRWDYAALVGAGAYAPQPSGRRRPRPRPWPPPPLVSGATAAAARDHRGAGAERGGVLRLEAGPC